MSTGRGRAGALSWNVPPARNSLDNVLLEHVAVDVPYPGRSLCPGDPMALVLCVLMMGQGGHLGGVRWALKTVKFFSLNSGVFIFILALRLSCIGTSGWSGVIVRTFVIGAVLGFEGTAVKPGKGRVTFDTRAWYRGRSRRPGAWPSAARCRSLTFLWQRRNRRSIGPDASGVSVCRCDTSLPRSTEQRCGERAATRPRNDLRHFASSPCSSRRRRLPSAAAPIRRRTNRSR